MQQFKGTGVWPDFHNTKSIDQERAKGKKADRERSASRETTKKDNVFEIDFSSIMSDAALAYEKQGLKVTRRVKSISDIPLPPVNDVPILIPKDVTPPPEVEELQDLDPHSPLPEEELEDDLEDEDLNKSREEIYTVGQEISDQVDMDEDPDVEILEPDQEEDYSEEHIPPIIPSSRAVVQQNVVKTHYPKDIPVGPQEDWQLVHKVEYSTDPRTSKDRRGSSGRHSRISLHNRSRSRSRSSSPSRSRSRRHKRKHKRRRRRSSSSSSGSESPKTSLRNMFSSMSKNLSQSIGSVIAEAIAPLATQSIAPAPIRRIPITEVVESVVPSGTLPKTAPRVPTPKVPSQAAPRKAPVVPQAELVLPSVVHQPQENVSSESDSDSDNEKSNKSGERKTRRRKWCSKMFDYLPDIEKPESSVSNDKDPFWGSTPIKSGSHDFPVIPLHKKVKSLLDDRINIHFRKSKAKKKKFNPSKAFNKIYRAPDDTHFAMSKAHAVSAMFLAEMKPDAIGLSEVGTESRLKKGSESGKVEALCLERQEKACTAFRMINSSQLDNSAIDNVFGKLSDRIKEFHNTSRLSNMILTMQTDNPLRRELNNVLSIVRDTEHSIDLLNEQTQDLRQTNQDLFNLHANDYVEAVTDRRKLWLDHSRIGKNVQRELAQFPIDSFSDSTRNSGDLLGAKATVRLEQELEARKASQAFKIADVTIQAVTKFSPASNKTPKANKQQPNKPKKKAVNTNSQSENTNNSQPFRGGNTQKGGRGGGGRGKGGAKPFTPKKGKGRGKGSSE